MTLEDFLKSLCAQAGWPLSKTASGDYNVIVPTAGGRLQKLIINEFVEDGTAMARVRSVIGAADILQGDRPMMALRMNATLRYGAFAVEKDHLVIADTHLLEGLNSEQKVRSMVYLAEQADRFEKMLLGKDQH
ncbi:MAG: YbjN domain-containing protein [Planctomycetes bacterium]|nr:YbjN domain-containing protein [Planctomycetota bacterium]